jgi:RNase P subunit RPR2
MRAPALATVKVRLRGCERCRGDLVLKHEVDAGASKPDQGKRYYMCLACGWEKDA